METIYTHWQSSGNSAMPFFPIPRWMLLWLVVPGLWAGQPAGAQVIPDIQWTSFAKQGLAIKTDGTIFTTTGISRGNTPGLVGVFAQNVTLSGTEIFSRPLDGVTPLGGLAAQFGLPVAPIGELRAMASGSDGRLGVVGRETNLATLLITKTDAAGNQGAKSIIERSDFFQTVNNFNTQVIIEDLVGTPDGGFVLLVTSADPNGKTVVFVRRYNASLQTSWTQSVAFPTPNPTTPDRSLTRGKSVIRTPDGGFLVVGFYNTSGNLDAKETGWAAKLDGQGNVVWQKLLNGLPLSGGIGGPAPNTIYALLSADDATLTLDGTGYALVGTGGLPSSPLPRTAVSVLELNSDGSFRRARALNEPSANAYITRYNSNGQNVYAVATTTSAIQSVHPVIVLANASLDVVTRRDFIQGASPYGAVTGLDAAGDGSLVFTTFQNLLIKLQAPGGGGSLALTQPTYNCSTGAITFNVSGGDGSPITYTAPGIMRSSPTSNVGTVEAGLRADPKPIPITATQSGNSVTFTFDLPGACNSPNPPIPPTGQPLTITAPTYDCQTGAIVFNVSGGDNSPITYVAPGISRTAPTNNFGTVEAGLRADPKPIPITAIQSGVSVTYNFDLRAACGPARLGLAEAGGGLQVRLLGNPVAGPDVVTEVTGAKGQRVDFVLSDASGRRVASGWAMVTTDRHRQTLAVGHLTGGLYLLRVSTQGQATIVKVMKQ